LACPCLELQERDLSVTPNVQIWLLRREGFARFTVAPSVTLATHQQAYTKFAMMTGPPVPFSQLPLNKDVPDTKLNAWGAYGKDDEKGFLNRQTDEIVKKAADSEIRTGKRYVNPVNLHLQWHFLR
jgi:hypothetical protein